MRRLTLVPFFVLALVACKDISSPGGPPPADSGAPPVATPPASAGETPAASAGEAPAASAGETPPAAGGETPALPPGVVVTPRPDPVSKTPPAERPPAGPVECTPDTRKGGVCPRDYRPVCGSYADNTTKQFSNACLACSDEKVLRYVAGPCEATK